MKIDEDVLKGLGLEEFVALDLETTGLDPQVDKIIELGAVKFKAGKPVSRYSQLVDPEIEIPKRITEITGIRTEDCHGQPTLAEALPKMLEFLSGHLLVAHNAWEFDLKFLKEAATRLGLDVDTPNSADSVDLLVFARTFLPSSSNHRLETLAPYFRLPASGLHRALPDAEHVGLIFLKLLEKALVVDLAVIEILSQIAPLGRTRDLFKALYRLKLQEGAIAKEALKPLIKPRAKLFASKLVETELQRLDLNEIRSIFAEGGSLAAGLDYFEERPQQMAMAGKVAQAFNRSSFLVAEAGTGVGKSFAYLVPAILWALKNGERIIVSTNTKNLQDQLFFSDVPALKKALGKDFQIVLLKGRNNYICLRKCDSALRELRGGLGFIDGDGAEYMPLITWLAETTTGDLAENNGLREQVKSSLADDLNYCTGRSCRLYERCYSALAREAAREADLVIINHALLLADLGSEHGILGDYQNLVIDEAHNLEEVAMDSLTVRLSYGMVKNAFDELYRREEYGEAGIIPKLRRLLEAAPLEAQKELLKEMGLTLSLLKDLQRINADLFWKLTGSIRAAKEIREEDYPLEYPVKGRYNQEIFSFLEQEIINFGKSLISLEEQMRQLQESLEELVAEQDDLLDRLRASKAKLKELVQTLAFLIAAEDENYVYWYELPREREFLVALQATPLNVAQILQDKLYKDLHTAIFTSATLSIDGDFEYFKHQVGLDLVAADRLECCSFGSPFDYSRLVKLSVPLFLPSPKEDSFSQEIAALIGEVVRRVGRRTMVLFTSYKLLDRVYNLLKESDIFLRAQGKEGSRSQILEEFKKSPTSSALLLGTDSFWEGIDLPGKSLEILILTRLPFPVPDDPIVEAKTKRLAEKGEDPFYTYAIPEAVIGLRQGFGRLIRTKEDRGVVIIADNRIVRKSYGQYFLSSLPAEPVTYYTPSSLLVDLVEFFGKGEG